MRWHQHCKSPDWRKTKECVERDPHLPAHYQTIADCRWTILCGEYWNNGSLAAHIDTKQQTRDQELRPSPSKAGTKNREQAKDSRKEDGTTSRY
jgi:hypothetical protein